MYRTLYKNLLEWKDSNERKPLVLFGARQTGKTWLLKEFGTNEYSNVAYINCDNNPVMESACLLYRNGSKQQSRHIVYEKKQ
jgi:predicted AAA+ superfamily ATPase